MPPCIESKSRACLSSLSQHVSCASALAVLVFCDRHSVDMPKPGPQFMLQGVMSSVFHILDVSLLTYSFIPLWSGVVKYKRFDIIWMIGVLPWVCVSVCHCFLFDTAMLGISACRTTCADCCLGQTLHASTMSVDVYVHKLSFRLTRPMRTTVGQAVI